MKKIFAMGIAAILVACGGSAPSEAQAQNISFKTGNNETFGAAGNYRYDFNLPGGWIKAYNINGAVSDFKDDGTLANRILLQIPELVQVSGTNSYINPAYTVRNVCLSGESIVSYPNSGVQVRAQDNCAMFQQLWNKAK